MARALVPPPRLRAKRVGISAPLQPGSDRPVSGLGGVMSCVRVLRIPAAEGFLVAKGELGRLVLGEPMGKR